MTRTCYFAVVTCAGFGLLAGCRTSTPGDARPGEAPAEPTPALTRAQVADVQAALGRTLETRGDLEQALHYYREAVRKDPGKPEWWGRVAVLADKQGMFAESEEAHRRALALEPSNPDLFCNYGYSLYLQQRWDEAAAFLQRAVELKPDHGRAHNNLGLVLARAGAGAGALASFERAGCSKADAHANLAYALMLNGDLGGARRQYETALWHDPVSAPLKRELAALTALAERIAPPGDEPGKQRPPAQPSTSVVTAAAHAAPAGEAQEVKPAQATWELRTKGASAGQVLQKVEAARGENQKPRADLVEPIPGTARPSNPFPPLGPAPTASPPTTSIR